MKAMDALAAVGDYTAEQWGMITTAQAAAVGVDSVTLYRLADAGHLEVVRHGVYAITAAPASRYRDVQAAWLSLNPAVPAWKRPRLDPDGGVVSHRTAALLHGLGDMLVERIVISVPRRRSTRDPLVQLRRRDLPPSDVTMLDGLPVTTVARTVEDLVADHLDGSHVGAAINDGVRAGALDLSDLDDRLGPYARRYGVKSRDGARLVDHLLGQIGTSRTALVSASQDITAPVGPPTVISPKLQDAISRVLRLNSPVSERPLSSLTGAQSAALARVAEQVTRPGSAAAIDRTVTSQQASIRAALTAAVKALRATPPSGGAAAPLAWAAQRPQPAGSDSNRQK